MQCGKYPVWDSLPRGRSVEIVRFDAVKLFILGTFSKCKIGRKILLNYQLCIFALPNSNPFCIDAKIYKMMDHSTEGTPVPSNKIPNSKNRQCIQNSDVMEDN